MVERIKEYMALGFTAEQALVAVKEENRHEEAMKAPARATGMSKEQKWERDQEKKNAEKEEFFKTHRTVRTAEENRHLVYEAMGWEKGKYFDKALYKATAKKMGCLGKRGVIGTYEEIK